MLAGDGLEMLEVLLALTWFACIGLLVSKLRERHPDRHSEMGLGRITSFAEAYRGVLALLRFVLLGEYRRIGDTQVTRLGHSMLVVGAAFLVLFLVRFLAIPFWEEHGSRSALRERAMQMHGQGQHDDAAKLYDRLLREDPADTELLYWRGHLRWKQQRHDEALADLRVVMEREPRRFDAYHVADRALAAQSRFDERVELWNRYLAVDPDNAKAILERGGAYYRLRNYSKALEDGRRACELGNELACKVARELGERMPQ